MNDSKRVTIGRFSTGVPGLDTVIGGAVPEYSFNLIAGSPGTGKTTLAHQIAFSASTPERRALFFTVLGEPPLKMLRYQQQFAFFDGDLIPEVIRFINLDEEALSSGFDAVLAAIEKEVASFAPSIVFIDSIRTLIIIQRYVEMEGQIRRVLTVLKMRGSAHDTHLRLYTITSKGLQIGSPLEQYRGILTGIPSRVVKTPKRPRK